MGDILAAADKDGNCTIKTGAGPPLRMALRVEGRPMQRTMAIWDLPAGFFLLHERSFTSILATAGIGDITAVYRVRDYGLVRGDMLEADVMAAATLPSHGAIDLIGNGQLLGRARYKFLPTLPELPPISTLLDAQQQQHHGEAQSHTSSTTRPDDSMEGAHLAEHSSIAGMGLEARGSDGEASTSGRDPLEAMGWGWAMLAEIRKALKAEVECPGLRVEQLGDRGQLGSGAGALGSAPRFGPVEQPP
jgi:hypothetical protein